MAEPMIEPMRPAPEVELAARLAKDLEGHFEELVAGHQDRLYAFLLGMTGERGEAEDLAQETFLKAYRALRRYPPARVAELRVGPWLRRIALNAQRNAVRRKRVAVIAPETGAEAAAPAAEDDPQILSLRRAEQERLLRALGTLAPPARAAILLHHAEDLPVEEVAAILRLPEGTVKSHVHRGLGRLRRSLESEEEGS